MKKDSLFQKFEEKGLKKKSMISIKGGASPSFTEYMECTDDENSSSGWSDDCYSRQTDGFSKTCSGCMWS